MLSSSAIRRRQRGWGLAEQGEEERDRAGTNDEADQDAAAEGARFDASVEAGIERPATKEAVVESRERH